MKASEEELDGFVGRPWKKSVGKFCGLIRALSEPSAVSRLKQSTAIGLGRIVRAHAGVDLIHSFSDPLCH